jgi:glutamine amidotransferase
MKVTVVDLGVGNVPNVVRALQRAGAQVEVTHRAQQVLTASCLVLPGVGAAPPAVRALQEGGLGAALHQAVAQGAWLLGICLGHQLLFAQLEEFGSHQGLGFFPGKVEPLPPGLRRPHVGWAQLQAKKPDFPALCGRWFYFVHSYVAQAEEEDLLATCQHQGQELCAAVRRGRVVGVQFHPEKSGSAGQEFLRQFLEMAALCQGGFPFGQLWT